jgi:hypothetical protein
MPVETGVSGAGGRGLLEVSGDGGDALAKEETADRSADAEEAQLARTPELVTPGDADANVPAAPVAARWQWYTGGTWQNVQPLGASPTGDALGLPVRIVSIPTVITAPTPSFAASAPHAGAATPEGQTFYLGGYDRVEQPFGEQASYWTLPVTIWQGGALSVDQGEATPPDRPAWSVQGSDGVDYYQLAARSDVNAVRDRLPEAFTAGGGLKVGLVDALPAGTNAIGTVVLPAAQSSAEIAQEATLLRIAAISDGHFAFGRAVVGTTTESLIVSPTYTEQTTNAQRSIVSTSAQDGPAGTGIRSLVIEYYAADMTGPYSETVVTNGLSPVDTVSTTICFVEKMYALTAGTTSGFAVGDVQLKAVTAGGGATIWSIPIGDRKTRGAHHYVATGSSIRVTSTTAGVNGSGAASLYLLFAPVLTPNYCLQQIGPAIRVSADGQSVLPFPSPITVDGPGKLVMAVSRDTASGSLTFFGSFTLYHSADV